VSSEPYNLDVMETQHEKSVRKTAHMDKSCPLVHDSNSCARSFSP
jgi:hypothetical protein